jgi:hypothetical protein
MALARCVLGKFLGVVCHCFPLTSHIRASELLPHTPFGNEEEEEEEEEEEDEEEEEEEQTVDFSATPVILI